MYNIPISYNILINYLPTSFIHLFILQAFTATGTNLQLMFTPSMPIPSYHQSTNGTCNFEKERGMVSKTYNKRKNILKK